MKVVCGYAVCWSRTTATAFVGPASNTPPLQLSLELSQGSLNSQPNLDACTDDGRPDWAPTDIGGLFVQYEPAGGIAAMLQPNLVPDDPIDAHARAAELDQIFTTDEVARDLLDFVIRRYGSQPHLFIEPSAGLGAFLKHIPASKIGIELDCKIPGLLAADFLTVSVQCTPPIIVVGNPPFGKNSATAVKFFNHAARMADVIAFVLPRTFRKASIQNRLHENFHLVEEIDVPPSAFTFRSKPCDVPCTFQIWERRQKKRELHELQMSHPDFEFTDRDNAHFAVQRVGANAGRVHHDFEQSTWRSGEKHIKDHYFIRGRVEHIFKKLDFAAAARNTAGNPSLAKTEIVSLYAEYIRSKKRGKQSLAGSILNRLREVRLALRLALPSWFARLATLSPHPRQ
ncbi:hypothetical protein [Blastomonas fulva]|uniref:hypothetical protein n=1 Tax=Blastomonas fulva TaxID=1550728 RepID=UPI003D2D608E